MPPAIRDEKMAGRRSTIACRLEMSEKRSLIDGVSVGAAGCSLTTSGAAAAGDSARLISRVDSIDSRDDLGEMFSSYASSLVEVVVSTASAVLRRILVVVVVVCRVERKEREGGNGPPLSRPLFVKYTSTMSD